MMCVIVLFCLKVARRAIQPHVISPEARPEHIARDMVSEMKLCMVCAAQIGGYKVL